MSKEEISIKSTVKPLIYDWEQDGNDLFLHLGLMRKAIVITRMIHDNKSKISHRSFFAFPSSFYDEKFNTIEEAKKRATDYFLEWFSDTNKALNLM